ncbi:DNA polymerase I [Deferribacterales bacterium Es71-Z0220]|uniref:DNA polymerase I n=1 Tax=Deferrivibrio essentukiensis TaxID=2880922 RepID=UPI001F60DB8B|nr:DNA polymerase I [Deferrivibrio essentukiensis]MCB4204787.1 DNA polymerase I [Deferrivibrio essentukiensis]
MSTIIIDGHSVAYRIFYKVPPLTNSKGEPTGLIHSFINTILSIKEKFNPEKLYVTFDSKGETDRHKMLEKYKANRPSTPEDLIFQVEKVKEILPLLGIDVFCIEGIEADDIIYTLTEKSDGEVYLVTKDKDLMQLVNSKVKLLDYQTGNLLDKEAVKEKIGVYPDKILDFLALCGDSADNIPGVKGVGPKTAIKLLEEYGSLEGVYENVENIKGSLKNKLTENKELAFLSRELARLKVIDNIETLKVKGDIKQVLKELELNSLYKRIFKTSDKEIKSKDFSEGILFFIDNKTFLSKQNEIIENAQPTTSVKYVYDIKNLYKQSAFYTDDVCDLLLISWLNNPDSGGLGMSKNESVNDFIAKVRNRVAEEIENLKKNELYEIYFKYELPLTKVIARMENAGITLDRKILDRLNDEIQTEALAKEKEIYSQIGEEININSPKQLREVLFDKLKLSPFKKTKTGFSTDEESLRNMVIVNQHSKKLLENIIEYRELTKLLNTYITKLPEYIDKDTGRIYSEFKQTGTATGRFSSNNPNLQNIPLKGKWGKKIRSAFVASEGKKFISFDYSQIELRFLAHFSQDETLLSAFKNNLDIHKITGSKIFKLPEEKIEGDLRRIAKAVNFGILYGLSPFGLARDTGVSNADAKEFIETYFKTYPKVKRYIEQVVNEARKQGFVKTILGRKRFFPEINSKNPVLRNRSERMALNSILQGSAADVIKLSMLKSDEYVRDIDADIVLQIHDELVFEVDENIALQVENKVKYIMENVLSLDVKLEVNSSTASNLGEAK